MLPLIDLHCHLLAGLDDGPRTEDEALAMCRLAYAEGVRMIAATAHQNERWPAVTPESIRQAWRRLVEILHAARLPLVTFPSAEVMVRPDAAAFWRRGEFLTVADRGQYALLEMPHGLCVDLRSTLGALRQAGVRPILAHPERNPELLHDPGHLERLIRAGCLVQVSSGSVTDPPTREDGRALRRWFRCGLVHLLGSDGHSPDRRPPRLADAVCQVRRWAGSVVADRVSSVNATTVLQGLPLRVAEPDLPRATWFSRLW
jgi:protein-tyrosine phosphatase